MISPDSPRLLPRTNMQKNVWTRYKKLLDKAAKKHNIAIDPLLWNGIRNAWYDGYWFGVEQNK